MPDKQTTALIIIGVAAILYYLFFICKKDTEHMAPLNDSQTTFKNNYPRGRCNMGSFKRSDCSVGNCPIGSPISNKQFCDIQCAQGVGKKDRKKCYDICMRQMKGGCR